MGYTIDVCGVQFDIMDDHFLQTDARQGDVCGFVVGGEALNSNLLGLKALMQHMYEAGYQKAVDDVNGVLFKNAKRKS